MKICSVGAELFHANGQTDMTMVLVTSRNFPDNPKRVIISLNIFIMDAQWDVRGRN
jgi:hypothetical protein